MSDPTDDAVDYLQSCFEADPVAMHCLMVNRIPVNQALADHQHALCEHVRVLPSAHYTITALGLLNGLLTHLGYGLVAGQFDDNNKLVGFQKYNPPEPQEAEPC